VLSCLANLSNDEVFTPPEVVNQMLDMLPQELFRNPDTKFLDPACKTGVFLREIAKRLIVGLEPQIPDLQERIDHIFHKQLFGIAITELSSLLSRRGIYCSKYPNTDFSVSKFDTADSYPFHSHPKSGASKNSTQLSPFKPSDSKTIISFSPTFKTEAGT
jgi:site-specific DNA-methyltransferase (adenine-specific)